MKPLTEKLLLATVVILMILQVVELPVNFNKIGIPYGAKSLNSQGLDVYKVAPGSTSDSKILWASTTGTYSYGGPGAGLAYGHLNSNSNALRLQANNEGGGMSDYIELDEGGGGIFFLDINGIYQFNPDWTTHNNTTFYDGYYNVPCFRIVRQGNNDYRLQVMQAGSWVTK